MGVDHYCESGCLLLAETLFAAELRHATSEASVLPDFFLNEQRRYAVRLLNEAPNRKSILERMVQVCSKTREELDLMVCDLSFYDKYDKLQEWVGEAVLRQVAEVASSVLERFGVRAIGEQDVVANFVDPSCGFDDFHRPLQLYICLQREQLWRKSGQPKKATLQICGYIGIEPDALRETSWVRISY